MANTPYFTKAEAEAKNQETFREIKRTTNSISAGEGGKVYDTLADAQAESPVPSDGTIFQVSEITDSANAGFYSFQSSEANGTRFEKPFALKEAKEYTDENALFKNDYKNFMNDVQFNFSSVFNGVSSKLELNNSISLENEGDFIEFDFIVNSVSSNKGLSIIGESGGETSAIGFLSNNNLAIRSSLGNFITPQGGFSSFNAELETEYKIKLEWTDTDIAVYKNGDFVDNITKEKLVISNIGNSYDFFDGKIKGININSNGTLTEIPTPFLYEDGVKTDLSVEVNEDGFLNQNQANKFQELKKIIQINDITNPTFLKNIWSVYDGTAFTSLDNSFLLQNENDFIEFDFIVNSVSSNKGLSIIGESGGETSAIGFLSNNNLAIRSSLGNFITPQGGFSSFNAELETEYKIKLEWTDTDIAVYKNGDFVDNITKEKLVISNIGNSYDFFDGKIKGININSNGTLTEIPTPFSYKNGVNNNVNAEFSNQSFLTDNQFEKLNDNTSLPKGYYSFDPSGYNGNPIFYVYSQISDNYYARFQLAKFLDLSDNVYSDQYRIVEASLYKLSNDEMISQDKTLITNGESEFVYRTNGSSDFTGGIHGDETIINVEFYASGVKITDLSSAITLTPCNDFYYAQKSNMHTTDDLSHPVESIHDKITTFSNGGYKTFNRIKWLVAKDILSCYHAISCISKDTATEVHNEYLERETFTGSTDYFLRVVGNREYYGNNTTTGLSSFATSRLLKPSSEDKNCEFYIWDRETDSKMYRSFEPTSNTQVDEVWESIMEVYYKVK